jgi:long-chain fatty acid transport protein
MGILRIIARTSLAVVLLSATLFAAGIDISGVGARARAMGGAFRAVADDWSAAYYNPAGYALLKDNQWGTDLSFFHLRDEITPDYNYGGPSGETGVFNGRPIYNQHALLNNPSFGLIGRLPVWGETVFGLSIYQPFDQNISWNLYRPLREYNDSIGVPDWQYTNNIDIVAFQLTAAREFIPEKLSIGVGLQLLRGDIVYDNIAFRTNPIADENTDRIHTRIPELTSVNADGWGFGFRVGVLYKLSDKADLGATVNIPFNITLKGSSRLNFIMPRWAGSALPNGNLSTKQASTEYLFKAGESFVLKPDVETTLKLPASFGAGLSYRVSERLRLALDGEYTLWSSFDGLTFAFSNFSAMRPAADSVRGFFTANVTTPFTWKNALKVALGADFEANKVVTLMGGISWDQGVSSDHAGFVPQFADAGSKFGFSGGAIFHVQNWDLGVTGGITTGSKFTVPHEYSADGSLTGFPGEYKATTLETVLSVKHRF